MKQRRVLGKQRLAEKSKKRAGLADAFGDKEKPAEDGKPTKDDKPKEKKLDDGAQSHQPLVDPLSPRELEVLNMIAKGHSNREISEQLFLALNTIKGHNRNIYGKLGVKNRTQAINKAVSLKIISQQ